MPVAPHAVMVQSSPMSVMVQVLQFAHHLVPVGFQGAVVQVGLTVTHAWIAASAVPIVTGRLAPRHDRSAAVASPASVGIHPRVSAHPGWHEPLGRARPTRVNAADSSRWDT